MNNKLKSDKVIIIRLPNELKTEYEKLLDENGMNLSKRIKLLMNEDVKKLKNMR
jgi:antitoxin component of RelBE/YafQ-DinJ toxin-antitoxin module